MLKVGLTGGIGSGKTTVSDLFKQLYSITVIDADEISRDLLATKSPAYYDVIKLFGSKAVLNNQQLDRKYIREIVFSDEEMRKALENIIHPSVHSEISIQAQSASSSYCLIVIPLLIEANMQDLVDRICVIDTTLEQQIKRIQARDHCDYDQAMRIVSSQLDRNTRLAHANDVIINNGDLSDLNQQLSKLHKKYLAICH